MISLDRDQVAKDFEVWRDTPEGQIEFGMGRAVWAAFFFWFCFLTAILLICSVIGVLWGFRLLRYTLKLGPIRADPEWNQLQVLITPAVIVDLAAAKQGSDLVPAMFVATFENEPSVPLSKLYELSNALGRVHAEQAETRDERLLRTIIGDSKFPDYGAVRLPERWTGPYDVFAWTALVKSKKLGRVRSKEGDKTFAAFVGVPTSSDDNKIMLNQIPWPAVKRGVYDSTGNATMHLSSHGISIEERREARDKRHRRQFMRNFLMTLFFMALPFVLNGIMETKGYEAVDEIGHAAFFQEKIGAVDVCTCNFARSLTEGRGNFVYHVEGTNGKGLLIVYDRVLRKKRYWLEVDGKKQELEID